VDVLVEGLTDLAGVTVAADGTAYVAEPHRGRVHAVAPDGHRRVAARALGRPHGLALDADGHLLIVERARGRVLRRDPGGGFTVVASGLSDPEWIAAAPDGTLFVTARRLRGPEGTGADEARVVVRREPATGALRAVARDLAQLEGLALDARFLYAAGRGAVLRFPLERDGTLGPPARVALDRRGDGRGLAVDARGAVWAALAEDRILKLAPGGRTVPFARHLRRPAGVALGPDGALFVADGGRLLRFAAPPPPRLAGLPAFTNHRALTVGGATEAGALVELAVDAAVTASTVADATGAFVAPLWLAPNALTRLAVVVTAHRGDGLTGAPAHVVIVEDEAAPLVALVEPAAGAFVRGAVTVRARATDAGGVQALALSLGGQPLPGLLAPAPPAPDLLATAPWDTLALPDGTHTLAATARDAAGNTGVATRVVVVDNTPPDTTITRGPSGGAPGAAVAFTLGGEDNLTPAARLQFAWRLDAGPLSAWTTDTEVMLDGLAAGPHVFEARARDLAGHEDPTPARSSFTVGGLGVRIVAPAPGEMVPAGLVLVSGVVEGHGGEVGVVVNGTAAAVQADAFHALVPVGGAAALITAVATTARGDRATHTVAIGVAPDAVPGLVLFAAPATGEPPLTVGFILAGVPNDAVVELDADGDGVVEFTGTELDEASFTYDRPGLYLPSARVTDPHGAPATVRAVVQVHDPAALDQALRARWAALKDALRRGDVAAALEHVVVRARSRYEAIFRALSQDLAQVDSLLGDLALVEVRGFEVVYEMTRLEAGVVRSFEVRFRLDEDGIWRLSTF
jgi:sugar lactone lactonase YvrE